jgi:enoyl-CoA hydratase/carnithine racemase
MSVLVEVRDGVAEVRLDRPERRNAIDDATHDGLLRAGGRIRRSASSS